MLAEKTGHKLFSTPSVIPPELERLMLKILYDAHGGVLEDKERIFLQNARNAEVRERVRKYPKRGGHKLHPLTPLRIQDLYNLLADVYHISLESEVFYDRYLPNLFGRGLAQFIGDIHMREEMESGKESLIGAPLSLKITNPDGVDFYKQLVMGAVGN